MSRFLKTLLFLLLVLQNEVWLAWFNVSIWVTTRSLSKFIPSWSDFCDDMPPVRRKNSTARQRAESVNEPSLIEPGTYSVHHYSDGSTIGQRHRHKRRSSCCTSHGKHACPNSYKRRTPKRAFVRQRHSDPSNRTRDATWFSTDPSSTYYLSPVRKIISRRASIICKENTVG